jgi:hypothetical protein
MTHTTISLTPLQAAIILVALEEYQADYEAALNGIAISDKRSVEDLAAYTTAATECELAAKAINRQLSINH